MMTIKQYAESQNISYEAVRKQISRFRAELKGHIVKQGRTQYLDKWAVEYLNGRRREAPTVIIHQAQDEEMSRQIEALKARVVELQGELLKSKDQIIALQTEAQRTIEERTRYAALLEDSKANENRILKLEARQEEDRQKIETLQRERDEAQAEAHSFHRSFFGFYRKG